MTVDEAYAVIKRVWYRDAMFLIRVSGMSDTVEISLRTSRPSVVTGEAGPLVTENAITGEAFKKLSEKGFIEMLYDMVKRLESHEVAEHFLLDERHFVDPHPISVYELDKGRPPDFLIAQSRGKSGYTIPLGYYSGLASLLPEVPVTELVEPEKCSWLRRQWNKVFG